MPLILKLELALENNNHYLNFWICCLKTRFVDKMIASLEYNLMYFQVSRISCS